MRKINDQSMKILRFAMLVKIIDGVYSRLPSIKRVYMFWKRHKITAGIPVACLMAFSLCFFLYGCKQQTESTHEQSLRSSSEESGKLEKIGEFCSNAIGSVYLVDARLFMLGSTNKVFELNTRKCYPIESLKKISGEAPVALPEDRFLFITSGNVILYDAREDKVHYLEGKFNFPRGGVFSKILLPNKKQVLVIGGSNPMIKDGQWTGRYKAIDEVELYDLDKEKFIRVGDMSKPRMDYKTITLSDEKVLFWHNTNAEIYDTHTKKFEPLGTPSIPINSLNMKIILNKIEGNRVLITGITFLEGLPVRFTNISTWEYDYEKNKYQFIENLSIEGTYNAHTILDNMIFLVTFTPIEPKSDPIMASWDRHQQEYWSYLIKIPETAIVSKEKLSYSIPFYPQIILSQDHDAVFFGRLNSLYEGEPGVSSKEIYRYKLQSFPTQKDFDKK